MGEREGEHGHWQFPQGGVSKGSTARASVLRELREELGIPKAKLKIIKKLKSRHAYDWKSPPSYAKGKWRGQKQTFWLVHFRGKDKDIDLEYHEPEFQDWRWCTPAQVRKVADSRRLKGYSAALKEAEKWLKLKGSRALLAAS